jgi:heterodisulfide reductase subunit C
MSPTSLFYWGIPGYIIFWIIIVVAVALFLLRVSRLWRYLMLGKAWERIDRIPHRLWTAFAYTVEQWCQFKTLSRKDFSGVGHVLMAWGFFIFAIYYFLFIIIGAGFGVSGAMENNRFFYYYSWVMDTAAPLVILAALWGITRRYIIRPARLKGEQSVEAMIILVTVFIHPMTHLFKEATSIALGLSPVGLGYNTPFISSELSKLFSGNTITSIQDANAGFFWAHWVIVLFVLVFIAYSRYLHVLAAPLNILLRPLSHKGVLKPINFEAGETLSVSDIRDLSRKQLLESYSCVVCGRCQDVCPAYATDKPLNPKKVIHDIKEYMLQISPSLIGKKKEVNVGNPGKDLAGEIITQAEMLNCTTCGACVESCPVLNNHVNTIVDLRRKLVYEGIFDKGHRRALQRVSHDFNPWGLRWNSRAKRLKNTTAFTGLDVSPLSMKGSKRSPKRRQRYYRQPD